LKNTIVKTIILFSFVSIILFTLWYNKTANLNLNKVQNENVKKFNYLSITDNKGITKETNNEKLIKLIWNDINKLELSISKDTNVVDAGDYWLVFTDRKDLSYVRHSCIISPKSNKLIINYNVYDIKKGSIDFKKFYDMLPKNLES
jgi:hypothetical protein